MTKVTHEFNLYGKNYSLTAGELAKQATGAVVVTQGDSTAIITAVVSKQKKDADFFPLTVDYIEKMYSVGKIPGGYLKREARPSEKATLIARMIDRPLRPSFPDGFRNEVQIVAMPLVADQINPVDTICVMAASSALAIGGVPFEGPLACVRIARNKDTHEYIVNPTYAEREASDLDLELAGSATFISMLEASANEVSEEDMLDAMAFGQSAIAAFCEEENAFIARYIEANGEIKPLEIELDQEIPEVHDAIFSHKAEMDSAIRNPDVASRVPSIEALKESIKNSFSEEDQEKYAYVIAAELKSLEKHSMREMVVDTGERIDGRVQTQIRPLMIKSDYLPLVHGSGLFQRGQTQALSICTLGMLSEWQRLDTIEPMDGKRYIHHYNFPPYCTGEVGRMGSPKRREIGHGNLAERALLPMIPSEEEFPYTIRVVSEVMESNGSSSMASTCGSTLALMDAGVPLKRPVSGIAMGLIQECGKTVVLSDIQGLEDFLGDMDFKVCGTSMGITAMQMDNKATGLTPEILSNALHQAKEGRAFILSKMLDAIGTPRTELKESAPQIYTVKVPVDKIRDVIGSGGKVIHAIQDETGATLDVHEDGTVYISGVGKAGLAAKERVENIIKVPEVGEEYMGTVVGIKPFGAFVELLPGKDGLLHISRMAEGRVEQVEDVLNLGDTVKVVVMEVDEAGKISLDRIDKPVAPPSNGNGGRPHQDFSRRPGDNGERKFRRHH